METDTLIVILVAVVAATWLVPAVLFSFKVMRTEHLERPQKKQLLLYLWTAPIIGSVICAVAFSNMGKLRKLSESEHKSLWAAHRR